MKPPDMPNIIIGGHGLVRPFMAVKAPYVIRRMDSDGLDLRRGHAEFPFGPAVFRVMLDDAEFVHMVQFVVLLAEVPVGKLEIALATHPLLVG